MVHDDEPANVPPGAVKSTVAPATGVPLSVTVAVTVAGDPASTCCVLEPSATPGPLGAGVGLGDADGDADGEGDALGDADADGDGDAEPDGEGDGEPEADGDGLPDGEALGDGDVLPEGDADGDGEVEVLGDGEALGAGDALALGDAEALGLGDDDALADGAAEGAALGAAAGWLALGAGESGSRSSIAFGSYGFGEFAGAYTMRGCVTLSLMIIGGSEFCGFVAFSLMIIGGDGGAVGCGATLGDGAVCVFVVVGGGATQSIGCTIASPVAASNWMTRTPDEFAHSVSAVSSEPASVML